MGKVRRTREGEEEGETERQRQADGQTEWQTEWQGDGGVLDNDGAHATETFTIRTYLGYCPGCNAVQSHTGCVARTHVSVPMSLQCAPSHSTDARHNTCESMVVVSASVRAYMRPDG